MSHAGVKISGMVTRAFHDAALETAREQGRQEGEQAAVAGIVAWLLGPMAYKLVSPTAAAHAIKAGEWKEQT